MRTITIKIDNEKDAELLEKFLRDNHFEAVKEYADYDDLTDDELSMLEEREAEYKKDPSKAEDWETVRKRLQDKYGI